KARVALFKGGLIFIAAGFVIAQVIHRIITPVLPSYEVMSIFSIAGLLANGLCLYLLWQHRHEDINMSSVFECSRNDIATNLSVILAAIGVWAFNSGLPDIIIASLLAILLLNSSYRVIKSALTELKQSTNL
ncbi:cation transporter, partial [Candidatus Pacearchaeota archaeon]|nr:cation transporter [Candidatus Pacearchaeota archaeon]